MKRTKGRGRRVFTPFSPLAVKFLRAWTERVIAEKRKITAGEIASELGLSTSAVPWAFILGKYISQPDSELLTRAFASEVADVLEGKP